MKKLLILLLILIIRCEWNNMSPYLMFLKSEVTLPETPTIDIQASRISGVAPLSVFFDATGTTITDTSFFAADGDSVNGSYMDATFSWDFDSTGVDATIDHKYGSGFVAACVFKEPGIYTVQLKVYDSSGYIGYKNQIITVSEFSGTTYYVANGGSNEGTGAIDDPWATLEYALPQLDTNIRVLFKNGDTFTITDMVTISNVAGPAIISGYSDPDDPSSDLPIIYGNWSDADYEILYFSGGCSDIRIMDIAVRSVAESGYSPRYPGGIAWSYTCSKMLKYRTEEYFNGRVPMSPVGQYNTIADCEIHDTPDTGYTSTWEGATNDGNALIGNWVYNKSYGDQNDPEHIFRLQGGSRYFIAHNTFGPNILVHGDALTIRGNTEKVVIYKNKITGWRNDCRPQNLDSAEEYQHHIIWDSNYIEGGNTYAGDRALNHYLTAKDIVIRNSIIYDYQFAMSVYNDSVVGATERIKAYNNTFFNNTADSYFWFLEIASGCSVWLRNNIIYDIAGSYISQSGIFTGTWSGTSDYNMFYGSTWTDAIGAFGGNSLATWQAGGQDAHTTFDDPEFISVAPANENFAKLNVGSPAIDAGEALIYNALDYYGILRGSSVSIGASEE